jgi:hypothetical protein
MRAAKSQMAEKRQQIHETLFALRLLVIIFQSADPAGAEACRYSGNLRSIRAHPRDSREAPETGFVPVSV